MAVAPDTNTVYKWLESALPLLNDMPLQDALSLQSDGEIAFYGGTFSLLPLTQQTDYLKTAGHFVACGRVSGIRISTRPDALDDECITRLKAGGVTTIEIGCQSFDDSVLTAAGRGHTAADNSSAIQRCQSAGLQVGAQLMPGLPGGDADEALMSLRQALELKPSFVRIYPTVVIDGTELADLWKSGDYKPWALDEAVDVCADMLHLCRRVDIPVIRLGLHGDPQLEKNLLDGPYHPAFGQLVRSRLWRRAMLHACPKTEQLSVNPKDLSDVLGHRGENRHWLKTNKPSLCIMADKAVERGFLRMNGRDLDLSDL
ncbi:MAG: radical SAM protein [Deltaproteobacteria bacterium]|nr:MAG: radical SAM protein [Deltaproteobacteria bacterium]